jgi:hypothetical protein
MALRASVNLSEPRSLDPTEGNRGKNARVSCFVCPPMAMLAVLGRRETLLETAPADFEFPAASQNLFNGRFETALGRAGSLTLPQLCQNYMPLCVRIGKIDRLRPPLNA